LIATRIDRNMDKRTREGIEACRPGSDDLHSTELSDVARQVERDPDARAFYDRVQKSDAAIAGAMERVSVPQGLCERLLGALDTSEQACDRSLARAVDGAVASASAAHAPAADAPEVAADKPSIAGDSPWSRRRWLGACSAIAATILVAAVLSTWLATSAPVALEDVADSWFEQLTPQWQEIARAPRGFAVPAAVLATPTSWQWIARQSEPGVAYQLQSPSGHKAMLYVVRMSRPELPGGPPTRPQSATGGRAVGYWRSGQSVYVLVVPGDERSYREFINPAAAPLA
jgi:hypothetical protein